MGEILKLLRCEVDGVIMLIRSDGESQDSGAEKKVEGDREVIYHLRSYHVEPGMPQAAFAEILLTKVEMIDLMVTMTAELGLTSPIRAATFKTK